MLAIGRGFASSLRLMLLEEQSMGLAPAVADLIFERIAALIARTGLHCCSSSSGSPKRSNHATTVMWSRPAGSCSKADTRR